MIEYYDKEAALKHISNSKVRSKNCKYAKTYIIGKTTIHVFEPDPPPTEEEVERILNEFHAAGWRIIKKMWQKEAEKLAVKE
jgi:hypothetical protein